MLQLASMNGNLWLLEDLTASGAALGCPVFDHLSEWCDAASSKRFNIPCLVFPLPGNGDLI
jgi:hypothetical protein